MQRVSSFLSVAAVGLCSAALAPAASAQCVTGGAGGSFPGAGAVTGTWDASLPTNPLISTLAVTVPGGTTVLHSVVLHGLTHTYDGDVHVVLQNPAGTLFNVMVKSDSTSPTGGGCGDDFNGDYTIIDSRQATPCGASIDCTNQFITVPSGTYPQIFSTWTSGNGGLNNTPLELIPISSGTWTLYIYDWYPPADNGTLASWDLCFGSPTPPPTVGGPTMTCVTGGASGIYPIGGVDGTWPTTMPTGQLDAPLSVTVPAGSTKIMAVKLTGWTHTWYDDTQIVLESPSGARYNVLQSNDGVFGGTCGDTVGGDYSFVDAVNGQGPCGGPASAPPACSGTIPPGTYLQSFGAWPSGSSSILNTPLQSIPIASGVWTLHFYDWYVSSDGGTISSWDLCFDANPIAVIDCQLAPTATQGCNSTVSYTGTPSATSASPFSVTFGHLNAVVNGVVFYGVSGPNNVAWSPQSNLCVKSPTQRLGGFPGASGSTGGSIGLCNGSFTFNANAMIQSTGGLLGTPMAAGQAVNMQGWQRDPVSSKTTNLTDALSFVVGP